MRDRCTAAQAEDEQRLGHEVTVADGVEAVLEPGGEAQLLGGEVGVQR